MSTAGRPRVVVAGPDGVRAATLARALRDAGAEVVLAGSGTAGSLAATVVQEDADAVVVADPPPGLLAELAAGLAAAGADDVPVLGPGDDGTPPDDVVAALLRDR